MATAVLAEGEQGWGEGVPLLAAVPLADLAAATMAVPPAVRGGLPVKQQHERQELRRDVAERGEERCPPRDRVVRAAAIKGYERAIRVELQRCTHLASQRVGTGPGLERILERTRGRVEYGCPKVRECTRHEAAEDIARGNPAHAPRRLAQCRQPCQSDRLRICRGHVGAGQARSGV